MANDRTIARLESRIKERAAYAIEFELNDPRNAFITLTRCELARDLATVKLFYSVLGPEADKNKTARMLESASGFIQRQVGRVLNTRVTPRISWYFDDTIEKIDRMEHLLDEAFKRDREVNPMAHADWTPAEKEAQSLEVNEDEASGEFDETEPEPDSDERE